MTDKVDVLLVPLCILPLVVRAFFDTRSALFVHVLTMLILGSIAPSGFDFVYMQIITGMVAVFSVFNMRKRGQLFLAVGLIFLSYCVTYIGISLLNEGSIDKFNYVNLVWLLGNGFLTLLAYPLIFFIEKISSNLIIGNNIIEVNLQNYDYGSYNIIIEGQNVFYPIKIIKSE